MQIINFFLSILKRQKAGPGPLSPASPSLPVAVCEAPLGGEVELHFGGGPGMHSCKAVVSLPCVPLMIWEPTCLIGTRWVCYGRTPLSQQSTHSVSFPRRERGHGPRGQGGEPGPSHWGWETGLSFSLLSRLVAWNFSVTHRGQWWGGGLLRMNLSLRLRGSALELMKLLLHPHTQSSAQQQVAK